MCDTLVDAAAESVSLHYSTTSNVKVFNTGDVDTKPHAHVPTGLTGLSPVISSNDAKTITPEDHVFGHGDIDTRPHTHGLSGPQLLSSATLPPTSDDATTTLPNDHIFSHGNVDTKPHTHGLTPVDKAFDPTNTDTKPHTRHSEGTFGEGMTMPDVSGKTFETTGLENPHFHRPGHG